MYIAYFTLYYLLYLTLSYITLQYLLYLRLLYMYNTLSCTKLSL